MSKPPENRNLANEIGLCRIALVVAEVQHKTTVHPVFSRLFRMMNEGDAELRAHLTYFWWVALGGNRLCNGDPWLIPKDMRVGITPELLRDWLILFRETALPIIGEEFTRAWMAKAQQLARELLSTHQVTPALYSERPCSGGSTGHVDSV